MTNIFGGARGTPSLRLPLSDEISVKVMELIAF